MFISVCCVLLFAFCIEHSIEVDPGYMIWAYGIGVDTTRIVNKISNGYSRRNTIGYNMKTKADGSCVDASKKNGPRTNTPYPTSCDSAKVTQKWRYREGSIRVGTNAAMPQFNGYGCLDCTSGARDCYVNVEACNATKTSQQFYYRVHGPQMDLASNSVSYSVHSGLYPSRCLTVMWSSDKGGQTYYLDSCSGSTGQSFTDDQYYGAELDSVRTRVTQCDNAQEVNPNAPARTYSLSNETIFV